MLTQSKPRTGFTPDGLSFPVPETPDMFHGLSSPKRCGLSELITYAFLLLSFVSIFLTSHLPLYLYILTFAFWRLSYNLGLALLLHFQSNRQTITTWLRNLSPSARSLVHWATTRTVPPPYRWDAAPDAFNAWLAFRSLSTLVLANDGLSYFALSVATFRPLSHSRLPTLLLAFPTGFALLALSFWSKAAAHNALGDYAWFWGDFFFKVDGELVLNGVFELFPHPMYTVGYAAYYGTALICRSYTLLLVSLLAHAAQLVFLVMVEEPHIRKIYGVDPTTTSSSNSLSSQPQSEQPKSSVLNAPSSREQFNAGAPQPPVLAALMAMLATLVALCAITPPSAPLATTVTLCWRAMHWIGCSHLLSKQSGDDAIVWMRWFRRRGSNNAQAYSNWQLLFLFSYLLNHALFVITSLSFHGSIHSSGVTSLARDWSYLLGGLSLIAVALVSVTSTWSETGVFGFYYGDFFVAPENRELPNTGVFRYVSHPEVSLGYLAYYGLSLMRQSTGLFALAAVCQAMHMFFVAHIEGPHVEREYKLVRRRTALESCVRSMPLVGVFVGAISDFSLYLTSKMHKHGGAQLDAVSKNATVKLDKLRADINKKSSTIWDRHFIQRANELTNKAKSQTGIENCEKVISMLEERGLVVERVGISEGR